MTTVYGWFLRFRRKNLFATINHGLVMLDRERVGREASPSAAVIDSQSVKTVDAGFAPILQPRRGPRDSLCMILLGTWTRIR